MAAPYNLILRKTEKAAVALAIAAKVPTPLSQEIPPPDFANIVCGKASTDKSAPIVVVYAESGRPDPELTLSGDSHVTLHIMVKLPLANITDGTVDASDAFTAEIFDVFRSGHPDDMEYTANQFNAQNIPDYTAFAIRVTGEEAGAEEDMWVETLTLDVFCAPASGL